jgi:hypothetical protein
MKFTTPTRSYGDQCDSNAPELQQRRGRVRVDVDGRAQRAAFASHERPLADDVAVLRARDDAVVRVRDDDDAALDDVHRVPGVADVEDDGAGGERLRAVPSFKATNVGVASKGVGRSRKASRRVGGSKRERGVGGAKRRRKSLRIGVHHANGVVWGPL